MIAPCPLLLTWSYVVISDVNHAGLTLVVVTSHKVFGGIQSHVARWHGNVRIPAQIVRGIVFGWNELRRPFFEWHSILGPLTVIHTIVTAIAQRKPAYGALGVIGNVSNIWREA